MSDSHDNQPRCPCGFWGTVQNNGLCSSCFKAKEKEASISLPLGTFTDTSDLATGSQKTPLLGQDETKKNTEPEHLSSSSVPTDGSDMSAPSSSVDTNVEKVPNAEDNDTINTDRPVQKNKKRCFKCNCKLELAHRELGRCRCDYIFCQLHRLPEQHECMFDHKKSGRLEARQKMVSPKKHMGTSLRRLDSDT